MKEVSMYGGLSNPGQIVGSVSSSGKAPTALERIGILEHELQQARIYVANMEQRLTFLESSLGTRLPEQVGASIPIAQAQQVSGY